jgi:two-component system OmpR family sensor kinase
MWSRATDGAPSLRRRLLVLLLAAIALASAIQAATAYRTALRNADALFDAQLQQFAQSVGAGMPVSPSDARLYEFSIQVWGPDGIRQFRSHGVELPASGIVGFSDAAIEGVNYRIYLLRSDGRTIQVAQDLDARRDRARRLALQAMVPVALLAPLLMAAAWWIIQRALAPLEGMRKQVADRPPEDLSPLAESGVPREVLPLVQELNQMFGRVDAAFASQRHFVADAAHELRSPLTALKLQAQALRQVPPGPGHEDAVRQLEAGTDRAIQLLTQLLALARAEGHGAPGEAPWEDVELENLCRAAVGDILPQAHARRIDLGVQVQEAGAVVRGQFEPLRILLRNLLENAVKYTRPGGRVEITITREGADTVLAVEDEGPGIPPADRQRVFDRFYRGPVGQEEPGSGLGLAIVQAIARRHDAEVRLEASGRLGGLLVQVLFRRATGRA